MVSGGTYTGSPYPASAEVTDINGNSATTLEGVAPTLTYFQGDGTSGTDLGANAPSEAGTYTVEADFAGSSDYTEASGTATFTIATARPTISVSDSGGTYNSTPYPATATVTDIHGNPDASLEGVTPTLTYYQGDGTSGTDLGANAPSEAGTYTVEARFPGSSDYTEASSTAAFTITPVTPNVSWPTPATVLFGTVLDGTQLDATADATLAGTVVSVPGTFLYTPAAGTILGAGEQKFSVIFTPTDSNDFTTASATTSLTVLTVSRASTNTTLTSSTNPTFYDQPVTFTATVSPARPAAKRRPDRSRSTDGSGFLGTGTLNGTTGIATFSSSALPVGSNAITASYGGDANNVPSTSAAYNQVINSNTKVAVTVSNTAGSWAEGDAQGHGVGDLLRHDPATGTVSSTKARPCSERQLFPEARRVSRQRSRSPQQAS